MRGCRARPRIQASPTCLHPASGAIICPTITCALERSAIVRAAIAATTRTPNPSLPLTGSSGDCDARSGSRCTAAWITLLPRLCRRPAITRALQYVQPARGPPRSRAHARPPGLKAPYGSLVLSIGLGVRLCGHCLVAGMLLPLMVLWDATFKEKGGGRPARISAACVNVAVGIRP